MSHPSKLVKPPRLAAGDTIGLIAPSLPLLPEWQEGYEQGKDVLRSLGFTLKEGRTLGLRRWWHAGTPQQQADDINAMFADADVRAIVALNGGFSALTVLPHVDYDLIAANPKPFVGMSDITQYQLAMLHKTGLVGFHGNDVVNGFGFHYAAAEPAWQHTIQTTYKQLLTSVQPLGQLPTNSTRECWRDGAMTGRLIGGNLKRITPLVGTPYFPDLAWFEGAILFFEEIGETLYDIVLNLQVLKLAGVLDRIGGMVVGELTWINQYFDGIEHPSPQAAILDVLQEFDFPILKIGEIGHNMSMLPLPIGVKATLNATELQLSVIEAATD